MTPDTSGPTWRVPLAHYDPASSSWKTSQGMFPSDWPTSSETCPRWGMTRRGELFELPTPAPPTAEPASSSSLLPTPVADNSRGLPQPGTDFQSLPNIAISLLPTPRATDGTKGGPNQRGSSGDLMLPSAVVQLLPTPAVNDMGRGKTPEEWDTWTAAMRARHGNGNGHGPSLEIEAQRLLPTPRAQSGEDRNQTVWARDLTQPQKAGVALAHSLGTPTATNKRRSGRFGAGRAPNPAELANGAPTNPPSADGKASPDDPHQHQLSLDATDTASPPDSSSG
jgi:hypothetical protein